MPEAGGQKQETRRGKGEGGGRRGADLSGWLRLPGLQTGCRPRSLGDPLCPSFPPPNSLTIPLPCASLFTRQSRGPDDFGDDVRRRLPDRFEPLDGCESTTTWAAIGHVVGSSPQHRTIPRRRRGGFPRFSRSCGPFVDARGTFSWFSSSFPIPRIGVLPTTALNEEGPPTRPGGMRFSHGFGMTTGRLHTSPLSRRLGYSVARAGLARPTSCAPCTSSQGWTSTWADGPRTRSPRQARSGGAAGAPRRRPTV